MTRSLTRRRLFKKGAAAAASAALALAERHRLRPGAGGRDGAHVPRLDLARKPAADARRCRTFACARSPAGRSSSAPRPCNLCYSNVGAVLGIQAAPPAGTAPATRRRRRRHAGQHERHGAHPGPGGVGVVEAVGRRCGACRSATASACRARRSAAPATTACAAAPTCANCSDATSRRDLVPVADLRDGTPVYSNSHIGGLGRADDHARKNGSCRSSRRPAAVDLGMVLQLRERRRTRRDHVRNAGHGRAGVGGGRRRLRAARAERRAGRAHRRRVDRSSASIRSERGATWR